MLYALVLDARDWKCPRPLIETKLALRRLSPGQKMRLIISDSGSKQDIPKWLSSAGFEYALMPLHDEVMEIIILKRELDV
ncbi:sulfurtransferase TusA family protein [Thalassotalea litorea]|uniref:sulfurtransferase TusA family protein n=1 Tax=Thalassotalea litorea TaxID=2020715 RepID=UPI0037351D92